MKDLGFPSFGIAAIWEAIRYDRTLEVGPDGDGYVMNNSYRSYMAREVMERESDLAGFFETRGLREEA
jgi:hypothetical protein